MFEKVLIANRGEIACRIIRTAQRLGIATAAVYSEADAKALHVELADEAWPIGSAWAQESYLDIDKVIDTANRSKAQAVHPGYGFLAENAVFAERCSQSGLIFIGPSPHAIRVMGSKASAKTLMERAGVPVVPGHHGETTDAATLAEEARRLGFPLLIKASAGGGGRGMRIVHSPDELAGAIASAEREALASFGDKHLFLEKYLAQSRHIEVQIFGDAHGGVISFAERDCSMQRRHQKVLEETPAPRLSCSLRRAMSEAAIAAAKTISYVGAGTVEFLVQDENFFFLEMNTRLQVEHPITEMITGQDLVEWQFRIACGERLPLTQGEVSMRGYAMEARICAEDPGRDFFPSVGVIEHLHLPEANAAVRVDSGVRRGDRIAPHYDSLMAKLIVWANDRASAVRKLQCALDAFELVGVTSNLDFLRAIAKHSSFLAGAYDTSFIDSNLPALINEASSLEPDETVIFAAGAAAWFADLRRREQDEALRAGDESSPWATADAWRIFGVGHYDIHFNARGRKLSARIYPRSDGSFTLDVQSVSLSIHAVESDNRMSLRLDGVKHNLGIVRRAKGVVVVLNGRNHALDYCDLQESSLEASGREPQLMAPLPARVTRIYVEPGDYVKKGARLVALEAMKMEITITAPHDGVIESVRCVEGEMTVEGAELIAFAEGGAP